MTRGKEALTQVGARLVLDCSPTQLGRKYVKAPFRGGFDKCAVYKYTQAGLQKLLQPCNRAARKWRENEEMKRKLRENEEIERKWTENEEMDRE